MEEQLLKKLEVLDTDLVVRELQDLVTEIEETNARLEKAKVITAETLRLTITI